jgi:hypothetical protein
MPLALLTFVVLGAEWLVLREKTQALPPTPEGSGTVVNLGKHRAWLFASVSVLCTLVVVTPLLLTPLLSLLVPK